MKFSVLMSIYKNDKVNEVENSLNSIINQTLMPNQVVLVLDGPVPNELMSLVNRYSDEYKFIDIIPLEKNVGLGKALSIGLTYCKYEYVARMDSDDESLPDRFEKQINYLMEYPEVDVLGGQIAEYDSTMTKQLTVRQVPTQMNEIVNMMKSRNGMNHVTVIYKKSKVLAAGNYQHCPYFEDYYLWCRMMAAGSCFHNLKDILVNVRTGECMYRRRGGKLYYNAIITFQNNILSIGIINKRQYLKNLMIRLSVASMPNCLRGYLYKNKLRKYNMK